jgi:hypothetical protein
VLSPTSVWNQRLPANAPIDPNSAAYVASLVAQINSTTITFNFRDWGLAIFWANENTPRQKVWLDKDDAIQPLIRAAITSVPIPSEFRSVGPFPGDQIACILCPHADGTLEYYEFHKLRQVPIDAAATGVANCTTLTVPGWHCDAAAAVQDLRSNPGWVRDADWPGGQDANVKWGCSGSGLLLYPHVITVAEAQRRYIPHALRMEMPQAAHQSAFRWPALRSDGTSANSTDPQTGAIFTFAAGENFSDVPDPFVKAVCVAIRDYGWILTDSAANVALKCESQATRRGSEAYTTDAWKGPADSFGSSGAILSASGVTLAAQIPVSRLKIIDASYRPPGT